MNASQAIGAEAGAVAGHISNTAGDEARGDITVHELINRSETCIMDMRITDRDCKSYANSSSEKVLERAAKLKKISICSPASSGAAHLFHLFTRLMEWHARRHWPGRSGLHHCLLKSMTVSTARWSGSYVLACAWRSFARTR